MSTLGSESTSPVRISARGLGIAALNVAYVAAAVLAVLYAFIEIRDAATTDAFGFDFEGTLWDPAVEIREGRSPYPAPTVAEVEVGNPALYPPLLMLLVAPLTVLPWWIGISLWTALLCAAVAGTLYILNVRDARCYLLALVAPFTVSGVTFGNATLLLVPLVALAWRWRDHRFRTGALVGLAIASKLFLWPLLFWFLGTRRYKAFGAAVATAFAALLVPWMLIGFDGLSSYPDLLRVAEEVYAVHSNSVATLLSALGAETQLASRGTLALGVAIASAALYAGRRSLDSTSLSLAVLAAVLGSPIVWPYYLALLLIPVAIARPRFSGLWVALMLFYVANRLPRDLIDASDQVPGGPACCRPADVPPFVWVFNHSPPALWPAAAYAALAIGLVAVSIVTSHRARPA